MPFRMWHGLRKGFLPMQKLSIPRLSLAAIIGLVMACSSTRQESAKAPSSDDLLELLTGFGESVSKRNFAKAVDYMVPEEKAMMMENGVVAPDKQKMLLALPLQKLIRHPAIRVEKGHIAGIYSVLPDIRQSNTPMAADMGPDNGSADSALMGQDNMNGYNSTAMNSESNNSDGQQLGSESQSNANNPDPMLKETVTKFFAAVNKKNWNAALALMNDDEKKLLLDDKGRLKDASKQRLSQMDQKNRDALVMIDGKLSGVALLLP